MPAPALRDRAIPVGSERHSKVAIPQSNPRDGSDSMEAHGVVAVRVSTRTIHRPETGSEAGGHGIGTFRTEDRELFPNLAVAEEAEHTPCLLCFMPPQPWRTRPPTFFATACPDNELRAQMRDAGLPPAQEGLPGAAAGDRRPGEPAGVRGRSARPASSGPSMVSSIYEYRSPSFCFRHCRGSGNPEPGSWPMRICCQWPLDSRFLRNGGEYDDAP